MFLSKVLPQLLDNSTSLCYFEFNFWKSCIYVYWIGFLHLYSWMEVIHNRFIPGNINLFNSTLGFSFFILSILIITFARFSQIHITAFILNLFRHNQKISRNFQMVLSHSGFRGAMAFALATNAAKVFSSDKTGSSMLTLTIVYASFTVNRNDMQYYNF